MEDGSFLFQNPYNHIQSMYGIFTYIWLICMVNVGKYTSPMDAMGKGDPLKFQLFVGLEDYNLYSPPKKPPRILNQAAASNL